MTEPTTYVTQSKFFSPAFNAAIFDGPIRIYFAQYQEALALKVYFQLQERFTEHRREGRGIFKNRARNVFVMLYPSPETFDLSFGENLGAVSGESSISSAAASRGAGAIAHAGLARARLGSDFVVGVRGPLSDEICEDLYEEVEMVVMSAEA